MLSIGDLSRRTGVKVPTISYYEQMGLIDPPDRFAGNQRLYSSDALRRLSFIRHARDLGLGIDAIRELTTLSAHPQEPCAGAHVIAAEHLESVRERISRLRKLERGAQTNRRLLRCQPGGRLPHHRGPIRPFALLRRVLEPAVPTFLTSKIREGAARSAFFVTVRKVRRQAETSGHVSRRRVPELLSFLPVGGTVLTVW